MTLTTERQQFEEWFKLHSDEEECTNLLQRNSASTNYLHPHTDLAWIAWKASREVLANREAQPVEVRRALFTKISNRPADESGNIFYCVAAGEMDLLEAILTARQRQQCRMTWPVSSSGSNTNATTSAIGIILMNIHAR